MSGRRSSQFRRALVALLLGAVTTVLIAWAAMFWPRRGRDYYGPPATTGVGLTRTSDDLKIWSISEGRNAWHHVVTYWFMQTSGLALMIPAERFEAEKVDLDILPRHLRPASVDDLHMMAWYRETGWPLKALTCSTHWVKQISNADVIYEVRGGLQLPRDADFNPRPLPLTPLWGGFAVNTLVFAAPWWLTLWGLGALRQWSRRRNGRCIHCAYSLQGLPPGAVCPECGR